MFNYEHDRGREVGEQGFICRVDGTRNRASRFEARRAHGSAVQFGPECIGFRGGGSGAPCLVHS